MGRTWTCNASRGSQRPFWDGYLHSGISFPDGMLTMGMPFAGDAIEVIMWRDGDLRTLHIITSIAWPEKGVPITNIPSREGMPECKYPFQKGFWLPLGTLHVQVCPIYTCYDIAQFHRNETYTWIPITGSNFPHDYVLIHIKSVERRGNRVICVSEGVLEGVLVEVLEGVLPLPRPLPPPPTLPRLFSGFPLPRPEGDVSSALVRYMLSRFEVDPAYAVGFEHRLILSRALKRSQEDRRFLA